jgi:hypothetical protein
MTVMYVLLKEHLRSTGDAFEYLSASAGVSPANETKDGKVNAHAGMSMLELEVRNLRPKLRPTTVDRQLISARSKSHKSDLCWSCLLASKALHCSDLTVASEYIWQLWAAPTW